MTQQHLQMANVTQEQIAKRPVAGVIKRVSLKNFMCHANFELELGPRLNFIIGHNGSGKSSILTAISVCLGAKATETNRGNSLKDLIKEGTNISQIKVVLSNVGDYCFEPEKYGDEIIIERTIRRDGSGAVPYIIRSETGKKISSKKSDLDTILDAFSIAVSNPMVFLSQDQARSFLTASSDADKYRHFMRGTLMEDIVNNFMKVNDTIEKIDTKLMRLKESTIALKAKATEARELHMRLKESDQLRRSAFLYRGKYFWMEHQSIKESMEASRVRYEESLNQIAEIDNLIDENNLKIDALQKKKSGLDGKLEKLRQDLTDIKPKYSSQKDLTNTATRTAEDLVSNLEKNNAELNSFAKQIASLEKHIAKEEEKLREKNGGSKDALKQRLEDLVQEDADLSRKLNELRQRENSTRTASHEAYSALDNEIREKAESLNDARQELNRIKQGSKQHNPLALLNKSVQDVVHHLKNTRFSDRVIGPISSYTFVKSEHKKWTQLINAQCGAHVNTFIVRNANDQRQLKKLLDKFHCRSTILIRRPERFDFSNGKPNGDYLTVLDCLEFTDDDVKYALIDLAHLESVVLCDDRYQAQNVVEDRSSNVLVALCPVDPRQGLRQQKRSAHGAFMSDPLYYENIAKIGVQNASADTSGIEENIEHLKREVAELKGKKENAVNEANEKSRKINNEIKEIQNHKRKLASEKYNLDSALDDSSDSAKLIEYSNARDDLVQRKSTLEQSIPDLQDQIYHAQEKAKSYNNALVELKQEATKLREFMDALRNDKITVDTDIGTCNQTIHHFERQKAQQQEAFQDFKKNEQKWQDMLQESLAKAQEACSKEEADRLHVKSIENVQREIQRINEDIKRADELLGKEPDAIINEDEDARKSFNDAFHLYLETNEAKKLLMDSFSTRLKAFRNSRSAACGAAQMTFNSSLEFRNFSGTLEFDHGRRTLQMLVSTKNDKKPRNVDSLSGGEKSFSQIALLLSTWKLMRSRIKGLDEFDVFMDQVNRKIGMKLMLSKLSEDLESQTIFITPQDIGQIAELDENLVRIHRIRDPRAH